MLAATLLHSLMFVGIRHLSATLHTFEIAFFRSFFGLIVFVPILFRSGFVILETQRFHLHATRAVLTAVATLMSFTSIAMLPLAKFSALSFTAPLFAALVAVVLLRERIRSRRIAALVVGFIGALIIIRPGAVPIETGTLLVLGSSALWAFAIAIVKRLSRDDSSITITAYMNLLLTPLTLVPALLVWQWPTSAQYPLLFAVAIMGTLAHIAMAQAFKYADATVVLPYEFIRLVWAALLGLLIFAEIPSLWTIAGGFVIFASTTYIVYREAKLGVSDVAMIRSDKTLS